MAVYTQIDEQVLSDFLQNYDFGALQRFEGIAQGVSNSNFHVFTDRGRYILTIFEERRTPRAGLPFFFAYAKHLAKNGIACPQAYAGCDGKIIYYIEGKPAALVAYLEGKDLPRGEASYEECTQMGGFTAKMHVAARDFDQEHERRLYPKSWRSVADKMRSGMNCYHDGLEEIIYDELDHLDQNWPKDLPRAAIHADLFPDNVFFKDGKISAMIDMYLACTGFLALDLAIVINAWCFDAEHEFSAEHYSSLMKGYEGVRTLTPQECMAFQTICRGAALNFLLARLEDALAVEESGAMATPHDPMEYLKKLHFHQNRDVLRI